jgi:phosphatidylglycerophosphate synthase
VNFRSGVTVMGSVERGVSISTSTLDKGRPEQAAAASAQLLLLAGLVATVELSLVGVLGGVLYAGALLGLLSGAMDRAGRHSLGPADVVTLSRALLVGCVTALVVDGLVIGATTTPALVGLAAVALALDAVDGQVARRTGTTSALGARFDMEVDAFLILVLSAHVATIVGPWALTVGVMRYAFVVAGWMLPWLRGPLSPSIAGKTVAALQGVVLVVAATQLLPHLVTVLFVAAALALLCWSFGRDVRRLWVARDQPGTSAEVPGPRRA